MILGISAFFAHKLKPFQYLVFGFLINDFCDKLLCFVTQNG
jgi:hypothetical protein